MSTSCHGLITAYVDCLRQTECYQVIERRWGHLGAGKLPRHAVRTRAAPTLSAVVEGHTTTLARLQHATPSYLLCCPASHPPAHAPQERKKTVTQCAEERPEQCDALRYAVFACKRGQMDARSRIQGNKGY
jgi:hypothetical protein